MSLDLKQIRELLDKERTKSPEELEIEEKLKVLDNNISNRSGKNKWFNKPVYNNKGMSSSSVEDAYKEAEEKERRYGEKIPDNVKKEYNEFKLDMASNWLEITKSRKSLFDETYKNNIKELKDLLKNQNSDIEIVDKIEDYIKNTKDYTFFVPTHLRGSIRFDRFYDGYENDVKEIEDRIESYKKELN